MSGQQPTRPIQSARAPARTGAGAQPGVSKATASSQARLQSKGHKYSAGTVIFEEGDTSTEVYLLVQGTVEVLKGGQVIATIDEAMSYFGEMAALLHEPRTATIRAKTECEFLKIPGEKLDSIVDVSPVIGKRIMKALGQRLFEANKSLSRAEALIKKEKEERLADNIGAARDYKRLLYVVALLFKATKFPQFKELFDFARESSSLASFATRLDIRPRDFARYPTLSKLVESDPSRQSSS